MISADGLTAREAPTIEFRSAMVQRVTPGFGVPGNDNPVPPTSPLAISDQPQPRDTDRALLAEAGHEDGLAVVAAVVRQY